MWTGNKRVLYQKPDAFHQLLWQIIDFTKFKSGRVQKVEGIFFSPTTFSLFIPFCFFTRKKKVFYLALPVPDLKIHTEFPIVGLISHQSFLKAAQKLRSKICKTHLKEMHNCCGKKQLCFKLLPFCLTGPDFIRPNSPHLLMWSWKSKQQIRN